MSRALYQFPHMPSKRRPEDLEISNVYALLPMKRLCSIVTASNADMLFLAADEDLDIYYSTPQINLKHHFKSII
ncbi:unnamed protein product [Cuscuta campestris]|uniref:Uncharacterized protein n=1 Tax=Cuscuta campestris TaxID=132261 RepID=A0A484MQ06_9ASTE|nr:unnamed protein product [Cuscuta campestris]